MVKCSFCQHELSKGTGKMFVQKDGKIFYFCSSKCEKNNNKLGRKPRSTLWVTKHESQKKEAKSDKK